MKDVNLKTFIFSCSQQGESDRFNIMAHEETVNKLKEKGLTVTELDGSFKGQQELSIGIVGNEETVKSLCSYHEQETYLEIDANNVAYLVNVKDFSREYVGQWSYASEQEALQQDNWTKLPSGEYRITRKK